MVKIKILAIDAVNEFKGVCLWDFLILYLVEILRGKP